MTFVKMASVLVVIDMLAPVLDAASVLQYVSWACLLLPHVPSPHSLFPGRLHEADLADLTASCCSQHQMISSHVSVMCLSPGGRRAAWAIYFTSELVPWPISIVALSADHLVYQSAGALGFFPSVSASVNFIITGGKNARQINQCSNRNFLCNRFF